MLSIGPDRFRGRYEDIVGSHLLFENNQSRAAGFVASARKKLVFTKVLAAYSYTPKP